MERLCGAHLSYSLNSLKGGYIGIICRTTIGIIKEDTRSLEYGSYRVPRTVLKVVVATSLRNGELSMRGFRLNGLGFI